MADAQVFNNMCCASSPLYHIEVNLIITGQGNGLFCIIWTNDDVVNLTPVTKLKWNSNPNTGTKDCSQEYAF